MKFHLDKRQNTQRVSTSSPLWLTLLGAAIVLAYALRIDKLATQSIWYDEGYSIALAQKSLADIWNNVSPDHVPLFFWLLHFWIHIAGPSEFATRFWSLLPSVLAIPLTYKLSETLVSHRVAMFATLLSVLSPFYVYYAQEVRMYSMMLALTLLVVLSFRYLSMNRGRVWWFVYIGSATALAYTHYYGLIVLLALNVAMGSSLLLSYAKNREARSARVPALRTWTGAQLVVIALYAPWAWRSAHVFNDFVGASQATLTATGMFWNIVITFALGHSIERLNANTGDPGFAHDHNLALVLSSAFIIVVLAGLIYVVRSRREAISGFADGRRALLVTWLLVPALVVYLISVGKRDFTARHLISSAPAFYLLSAIGLYAFRKVNRALMVVAGLLLLVISIYSLGNYYSDVKYARDDMRSAAAFVQLHPMPQQAIIMDAGYFSQTFNYYYNVQTPWYGLPDGYPPDASATIARLDALGKQYDYLWLVLWQDYYSDPDRVVETFLDKNYVRTREEVFHGNIKVRGYSTLPLIAPNNLADAAPVNQQLGGKVELTGYTPAIMTGRGGQELDFTILWRALHSLSTNYTVFVHLNNSAGQLVAQADGPPAFGDLDSSNWPPGALIVDEHHLSVPLFTPPGDYQLDVGLYDRQTMRNLGAGGIDHVTLPVHLGPSEEGPRPNATSVDLGQSIQLAGYELKGNAKPGDTLGIDLLWKTKTPVVDDLTVFVHLVDSSGKPVAQSDAKPAADSYPTTMWQPGEIVRDGHQLKIPEDCPPGQYSIEVGLYDGLTGNRLAHSTFPWGRHETSILLRQLQINTR